jgi:hypothetical protein
MLFSFEEHTHSSCEACQDLILTPSHNISMSALRQSDDLHVAVVENFEVSEGQTAANIAGLSVGLHDVLPI